ncbi:MAG: hypothetical protein IPG92_09250 [Flavobacteriales bacterium]|nr:hypothetical protein [Flavobacteriales bacterium]
MMHRTLLLLGTVAAIIPAHAQAVINGNFEQHCYGCKTQLAGWELSWPGRNVYCGPDGGGGDVELLIACRDTVDAVGFVEQTITITEVKEPVIFSVSAQVRTKELTGKGASLNIACYDANGGFLTNKDQGVFEFNWFQGTSAARPSTLELLLPVGTASVKVGAIVNGRGQAWFDDFHTELITLEGRVPDEAAVAYIGAACDTIRAHALYRDSIDIETLRATALKVAGAHNDPRDHHLAVEYLLHALGDHHSFLMTAEEHTRWAGNESAGAVEHAKHRVIDGYGYVSVPGFASGDSLLMLAFADSLQGALASLENAGVRGWMIDLRQNTGGNMAPMVCGLGPLLDPGVLGTLTDVRGNVERWYYRNGEYGWDDLPLLRVVQPVTLTKKLPIAVLTAQQTGSSGECTTISFIGNSHTRSFGQPTFGLTTGNGQFALPDGAQMFMASTIMGDRNGKLFHGPIIPDEAVEQPADWKYDAAFDAALKWLNAQ